MKLFYMLTGIVAFVIVFGSALFLISAFGGINEAPRSLVIFAILVAFSALVGVIYFHQTKAKLSEILPPHYSALGIGMIIIIIVMILLGYNPL